MKRRLIQDVHARVASVTLFFFNLLPSPPLRRQVMPQGQYTGNDRRALLFAILMIVAVSLACDRPPAASSPPDQPEVEQSSSLVLAAVGDILMSRSIQAFVVKNNYAYDLLFEKIAPDLAAADLTIANLETPVDQTIPVSGYPRFNARPELLQALKKAGVDVVTLANNHIMDAGPKGVGRTVDNVRSAGIVPVGAGRTRAEASAVHYETVNGVSIAFLAYTYATNEGIPQRRRSAPAVNTIRTESYQDLAAAVEEIRRARVAAELVAVLIHWGEEYAALPTPWQRTAAAALVGAGADLVLGHHSHVLQPIEMQLLQDGRRALIAYSLGNFIAAQHHGITFANRNDPRAGRGDGIILRIHVEKRSGIAAIKDVQVVPLWIQRESIGGLFVHRPVSIARELAALDGKRSRSRVEEDALRLLRHRQKIIEGRFADHAVIVQ